MGRGKCAKRVDRNQPEIVKQLRGVGATVQHLHEVGTGCPDILVGYQGRNFVFEIKDPTQKPSQRKLTEDEQKWHLNWRGQKAVIETIEEAYAIIGITVKGDLSSGQ